MIVIPMASVASAVHKTGALQLLEQVPDFRWHPCLLMCHDRVAAIVHAATLQGVCTTAPLEVIGNADDFTSARLRNKP